MLKMFSIVLSAVLVTTQAHAAPELFKSIRAGDAIQLVAAQQGWYSCESNHSRLQRLCMDRISTLGVTGTFSLYFLDGRAFKAEFEALPFFLEQMLANLGDWRDGEMTLVSFETENTMIDVIKANNDLGSSEAMERFGRYLIEPGVRNLVRISVVPLVPPGEKEFSTASEYLKSLPPGGVLITLTKTEMNVLLNLEPVKKDLAELFPAYCVGEACDRWCVPMSDLRISTAITAQSYLKATQELQEAREKSCR